MIVKSLIFGYGATIILGIIALILSTIINIGVKSRIKTTTKGRIHE